MRFSTFKPDTAVSIKWGHPLADGLNGCWLINEGGGPPVDMLTNSATLAAQGAGTRGKFSWGEGLDCRGSGAGFRALAWNRLLQGVGSRSIVWRGMIFSGPSNFANLAGVSFTTGLTAPFNGYELVMNTAADGYRLGWNGSGFQGNVDGVSQVTFNGAERQVVGVLDQTLGNGNGDSFLWENRIRLATTTNVPMTVTYGATPQMQIGTDTFGLGWDSKSVCRHVYIYRRALKPTEIEWLYEEPYAFVGVQMYRRYFIAPTTPTANPPGMYYYQRLGAGNV